jgi:hypothetical protein
VLEVLGQHVQHCFFFLLAYRFYDVLFVLCEKEKTAALSSFLVSLAPVCLEDLVTVVLSFN